MSELNKKVVEVRGNTYKISRTSPEWLLDEYFQNWLTKTEENMKKCEEVNESPDYLTKALYEVMKEAIDLKQYVRPTNEFDDVERIVKIRIKLSREEIEKVLGLKTYSIYGVGLYTKIEGLVLSPGTRDRLNYDNSLTRRKGQYLNCDIIPEEILNTHEFGLAVPAMRGLFVPKKSRLTEWLRGTFDIQYFDIMQFSN